MKSKLIKKIIGTIGAILLLTGLFGFGAPSVLAQILGLPQMLVFLAPFISIIIGAVMCWYGFFKN